MITPSISYIKIYFIPKILPCEYPYTKILLLSLSISNRPPPKHSVSTSIPKSIDCNSSKLYIIYLLTNAS
jgi:hypothetical protein